MRLTAVKKRDAAMCANWQISLKHPQLPRTFQLLVASGDSSQWRDLVVVVLVVATSTGRWDSMLLLLFDLTEKQPTASKEHFIQFLT